MGNYHIGEPVGAQSKVVRGEPGVTPIVEYRFVLEGGETTAGSELNGEQWSRPFEWGATHFYMFDEEEERGCGLWDKVSIFHQCAHKMEA